MSGKSCVVFLIKNVFVFRICIQENFQVRCHVPRSYSLTLLSAAGIARIIQSPGTNLAQMISTRYASLMFNCLAVLIFLL